MIKLRTFGPLLAVLGFLGGGGFCLAESERTIPKEFRVVGTYELQQRVKVRDGKIFPIAIKPIRYEVYTDGITVRCYGEKGGAYTTYNIYRRDGITEARSQGLVERVPGIHGKSIVGDVMRQVTLTEEKMTLTRFPALSDIVEITYSKRVLAKAHQ